MKILYYIPSKNRPDVFAKCAMPWLEEAKIDYRVFIEPQDEKKYSSDFGGPVPCEKLVVLTDDNRGLGFSKLAAGDYAEKNKYDLIFKIDDDVLGWRGRGKNQKEKNVQNFLQLLNDCVVAFEKHSEVKGIGFPYRFELFEVKKWTGINARFQTCYITRTDWWHADECVSCFEDFAAFMFIRAHNGTTLRYGLIGIDCLPVGSGNGGHQDFDRYHQAMVEIKYLRNLYPALQVKKVDKPWRVEPKLAGEFFGGKKL